MNSMPEIKLPPSRAMSMSMSSEHEELMQQHLRDENRPEAAEEVVKDITSHGGNAFTHKANVAKEEDVQAMFKKMIQEFGTIDILVNNAGLQKDSPIDQMTLADWQFVLDVNLTGQFLCSREAIREFKRRGVRKEVSCAAGKIICMSSVHEV